MLGHFCVHITKQSITLRHYGELWCPPCSQWLKAINQKLFPNNSTELLMFIARLFLQHAAQQHRSAALIVGDMVSAYASVLLELVVGNTWN